MNKKMQMIILRGYPGSGKTTIGKLLEADGRGVFVDHNHILNFIAEITGNDEGIYDEISSLELAITKKLISDGNSAIVARGFSSTKSLMPYINIAISKKVLVIVVRLDVAQDELTRRVMSPERKLGYNPTTTSEDLVKWVNQNPIEPYTGEYIVDANLPIKTVVNQIVNKLTS